MKGKINKESVLIEGSIEWVENLIDRIIDNAFKNYYIKAKIGKKKRYLPKELNIQKVKHKFADTNFQQTLK